MRMTRFEPWHLMSLERPRLGPFATRQLPAHGNSSHNEANIDWVPAVDIIEQDERFVLRADVPGVAPETIDINMEKDVLTISGERADTEPEGGQAMHRNERRCGKFLRRFSLPEVANAERIAATCRNGILEISIPKQAQAQARRITVETA